MHFANVLLLASAAFARVHAAHVVRPFGDGQALSRRAHENKRTLLDVGAQADVKVGDVVDIGLCADVAVLGNASGECVKTEDGYALKSTGASSSSGSLLEVGAAGDVQVGDLVDASFCADIAVLGEAGDSCMKSSDGYTVVSGASGSAIAAGATTLAATEISAASPTGESYHYSDANSDTDGSDCGCEDDVTSASGSIASGFASGAPSTPPSYQPSGIPSGMPSGGMSGSAPIFSGSAAAVSTGEGEDCDGSETDTGAFPTGKPSAGKPFSGLSGTAPAGTGNAAAPTSDGEDCDDSETESGALATDTPSASSPEDLAPYSEDDESGVASSSQSILPAPEETIPYTDVESASSQGSETAGSPYSAPAQATDSFETETAVTTDEAYDSEGETFASSSGFVPANDCPAGYMSVPVNSVAPAYSQVGGVYPSPSASGFGSALGSGAVSASAPGAASASGAPSAAPFGPKPGYTRVPIPGSASSGLVSTTKSAFTSVSQDVSVGEPSASASTSSLTPQTGAGSRATYSVMSLFGAGALGLALVF